MIIYKIGGHVLRRLHRTCIRVAQVYRSKHHHRRLLASFDFDHTILDGDCYEAAEALLDPKQSRDELHALRSEYGWMAYIEHLLQILHQQQNVGISEIARSVRKLRLMPGIEILLRELAQRPETDMCIISDANSYFIEESLAANGLSDIFPATNIFTNSAHLRKDGKLELAPFTQQTHCDRCPANLCKGSVIGALMQCDQLGYSRVIHCGDGCNDLCAMVRLRKQDFACIRHGEQLHEHLRAHRSEICARVLVWRDGHELKQLLQNAGCFHSATSTSSSSSSTSLNSPFPL